MLPKDDTENRYGVCRNETQIVGRKADVCTVEEARREEPGLKNIQGTEKTRMARPGHEVSEICQKIGLEDLNDNDITKEKVKEEIFLTDPVYPGLSHKQPRQ